MSRLSAIIHEVHRRSLWQVLLIYIGGAWFAYEIIDTITDRLALPDWLPVLAIILFLIGLPFVLATAFVQEGGPSLAHTDPTLLPHPEEGGTLGVSTSTTRRLFTWRNAVGGGVLALALWGVVAAGWLLFGSELETGREQLAAAESSEIDPRSIAVLPFATRSDDRQDEYFTEGMHDDLLTQLAKIGSLKVISRTSVMRYAETTKPMREIAAELGVAAVLEGGVQRAGDRVRVNVQLIDAQTDQHLWAESYDEELTAANIFAIQTDLASEIAAALRARLAPEVAERIVRRPTESLEAYDHYARGRYLLSKGTMRADLEGAADMFGRAIEADSSYAPAWSGLAVAQHELMLWQHQPEEEALPRAWASTERALQLDETLAEAHVARGALLRTERRYREAEGEFRRALELSPGNADAHVSYGELLRDLGRADESIAQTRRAVELDPLSARMRLRLAQSLYFARRWEAALEEAGRVLELEPNNAEAYYWSGFSQAWMGDFSAGIAALRRAVELTPENPYYPPGLAFVHALAGDREHALAILDAVEGPLPFAELALVHAALGELDRAFAYLDRAYDETPAALYYLSSDPAADPLRADPRWRMLMEKIAAE